MNEYIRCCAICSKPLTKRQTRVCSRQHAGMLGWEKAKDTIYKKPILVPSATLCYILGVLKGDGCVSRSSSNYMLILTQKDKDFALAFSDSLVKIGLKPHTDIVETKSSLKGKQYRTKMFRVRASSIIFYKWYKGLTLNDVEQILFQNLDFARAFLRGFYESEGCVSHLRNKVTCLEIANKNRQILMLCQRLLDSLGIHCTVNYQNTASHLRIWSGLDIINFISQIKPCIKSIGVNAVLSTRRYFRYPITDSEILGLYSANKLLKEIGTELHCHHQRISCRLRKLGVRDNFYRRREKILKARQGL